MTLRQQAVRGVFWSAVQNWGSLLIGTGALLIMLRILSAEAFGVFALASAITMSIEMLLRLGFTQALVQLHDLKPAHLDSAFWGNIIVAIAATTLVIALAGPVAALFNEPDLERVLRWLAWGFVIGAAGNTHQAVLQRQLSFQRLAVRAVLATTAGSIVGVGMALGGFGLWSLVGQSLTAAAVGLLALWLSTRWRPGRGWSMARLRDVLAFGSALVGSEAVNLLNVRVAALLIGYFLGAGPLGYFAVAERLLMAFLQVLRQSVAPVAFPTFSRLQESRDQMRHAFYTATRMSAAIGFPTFVGMSVLAPELVTGLFGPEWVASASVLRILALAGAVESVFFLSGSVMLASGRPTRRLAVMLANGAVNVAAITLAVDGGINAVAAAFVVRVYLLSPLWFWSARDLMNAHYTEYARQMLVPLAASLAMAALVLAAKGVFAAGPHVYVALGIYVSTGIITYGVTVRLLSPALIAEARELSRLALFTRTAHDA